MFAFVRAVGACCLLLFCLLGGSEIAFAETRDQSIRINIPAGTLTGALDKLADQCGVQIMYQPALTEGITVPAVEGALTFPEALRRLLAQSGLKAERVNDNTVVLKRAEVKASSEPSAANGAAQDAPVEVEGVTVTARKREERLQDVPSSIAVATGEALSDLNIVGVTELDAIAPGLTFVTNPGRFGSGPSIAVRGISTQTQGSGVQDSVGILIDGVVIERAKAGAFPDLSDTARVEILRGPQGTLFGKNASAGVISITTKDPVNEFSAEMGLEYGTHDTRTARTSVSGPIVDDRLLGRFSAYSKSRDGYVENTFDGSDWEGDDQKGARAKLLFAPTRRDKLKLSTDYVEQKNDAGANIIRAFTPVTPEYVRVALGSIVALENDRINARSVGDNRQKTRGAALQWDRSIGEYTFTALSAFRAFNQDYHAGTYTWLTPLNDGEQFGYVDQEQFSQEIRLASPRGRGLEYVAGMFLLDNTTEIGVVDPGTLLVGTQNRNASNQVSNVETFNYAAFAEADANVTDRLTFTGGLRWTHEKVDASITGYPIAPGLIRFRHPLGTTSDSATAKKISWKLGGQWRLDEDRMLYVSVATGFKGPGFNVNTNVLGDAQPVRPETSLSYEAGVKSQFLDRRLTLNLNLYHSVFEDFQTQGGLSVPGNPTNRIILLNAEELVTQGFEAEMAASLGASTEVSMNATYIDATFKQFTNAPCYAGQALLAPGSCVGNVQNLSGARLPNTPKWGFNVFAKQDFAVPGIAWRGLATLDYGWRSSVQWNALGSPDGIEDAYGLLGASLGFRNDNDRIHVKVYGKNLTDKFHTSGIVVDNQITHFLPPDYRRFLGFDALIRF
jgi:iron complex outermembrane receptor protein